MKFCLLIIMSILYAHDSQYIQNASKTLYNIRKEKNMDIEEQYACFPNCDDKRFSPDSRTIDELLNVINVEKLMSRVNELSQSHSGSENNLWVIIATGSFCPIHTSHIGMMKSAIAFLKETNVAMGYFIPNNVNYTQSKLKKRGANIPRFVNKTHVINSIIDTLKHEKCMDLCTIDLNRHSYCEWYVCVIELQNIVNHYISESNIPNITITFALVGGEDFIFSPSKLYSGVDFVDLIFCVPRSINSTTLAEKNRHIKNSSAIILHSQDCEASSTKVRELMENVDYNGLRNILAEPTLNYIIALNK